MKDEELDLLIEYKTKRARYLAAKESGERDEEYAEAKKEYGDFRRFWRGVRDANGAPHPSPATISGTTGFTGDTEEEV